MYKVINLEKLSADGFKMPANTPNESSLDNITHAQLRYDTYSSPNIIQGAVVSGENSTFVFTVTETREDYKLYTSTNGTTYTENKLFGGANGTQIIASDTILDPADFTNAVPRSNGTVFSPLKIQAGTGENDMLFWNNSNSEWEIKTLVSSWNELFKSRKKEYKFLLRQVGTDNPTIQDIWINSDVTPLELLFERTSTGVYKSNLALTDLSLLHGKEEIYTVLSSDDYAIKGYYRFSKSVDNFLVISTYDLAPTFADEILDVGATIHIIINNSSVT